MTVSGTKWAKHDDIALITQWPDKEKISKLTGRSIVAINTRGNQQGKFTRKYWSYEDNMALMEPRTALQIAVILGRTQAAVEAKRHMLRNDPDFMWMYKAHRACQMQKVKAFNLAIENRIQGRIFEARTMRSDHSPLVTGTNLGERCTLKKYL